MFANNSQDVLNVVAFFRCKTVTEGTDTTEIVLFFGKGRVVPMKCLKLPKLEIQAALLASRLRRQVLRAVSLNIKRCFMLTDSTTVLQCLHSFEKETVFIAKHVTEVLELTIFDEWNHVPTGDNPADADTCGLCATVLFESS